MNRSARKGDTRDVRCTCRILLAINAVFLVAVAVHIIKPERLMTETSQARRLAPEELVPVISLLPQVVQTLRPFSSPLFRDRPAHPSRHLLDNGQRMPYQLRTARRWLTTNVLWNPEWPVDELAHVLCPSGRVRLQLGEPELMTRQRRRKY